MKCSILLLAFIFCAQAHSTPKKIKLNMNLALDGQTVSTPQLIVEPGKLASIESGSGISSPSTFIEVLATEKALAPGASEIHMSFQVGTIEHGARKLLSKPQVISVYGKLASIVQKDVKGIEKLKLSVTAHPVQ